MKKTFIVFIYFNFISGLFAQSTVNYQRAEYIEKHYPMAVAEMSRSGVPASITLAQGALESGNGRSTLAQKANNHFGIKCHEGWQGRAIYHDDDAKNECFRSYRSIEESYSDHSDFLMTRQRYAFLFTLDPYDYKGWARGLKTAGYATDPNYANSLIRIIEEFDLQKYDMLPYTQGLVAGKMVKAGNIAGREIFENNRVKYIIALPGDNLYSLAEELGKMEWELPRYNDLSPDDVQEAGQVIYTQPKRRKAAGGNKEHIVRAGETLYDISQIYAIRLDRLYKLNRIPEGSEAKEGSVLQLRKAIKDSDPQPELYEALPPEGDEFQIRFEFDLD